MVLGRWPTRKISFAGNCVVGAIHGADRVTGVTPLRHGEWVRAGSLAVTGVFVAIGHDPRN